MNPDFSAILAAVAAHVQRLTGIGPVAGAPGIGSDLNAESARILVFEVEAILEPYFQSVVDPIPTAPEKAEAIAATLRIFTINLQNKLREVYGIHSDAYYESCLLAARDACRKAYWKSIQAHGIAEVAAFPFVNSWTA